MEKGARKSGEKPTTVIPAANTLVVQRKIAVGAVDDPLEREADAMADQVMRMPEQGIVQRKCAHCEEEEKNKLQRKPETPFIQRQEKKEEKKEEKKDPMKEGLFKLGEELLKKPEIKPYTKQLKLHLWDNQPDEFKYSMIGFGVTNLAIMSSVFAMDPLFREKTISFLDGKDLFTPLSLIPKSEYFILTSAKYKLPKKDQKEIEFDGEFDFSPYFKLLHNQFLSDFKPSFSLSLKYNPETGHLNASGGAFNIKFYHDVVSVSGSFNKPMLKLPEETLGQSPFDAGLRKLPAGPPIQGASLPNDIHFMISIDLMKLMHHDDQKTKSKHDVESLQRKPISQEAPFIQRKGTVCEAEEKNRQHKALPTFIQKKGTDGDLQSDGQVEQQIYQTKGGGHSMDGYTKSFMESRFGTDFSDVKIHSDSKAAAMSHALQAHAFAYGNDIYFNEGKYSPETESGKRLLAHELTHTLQQNSGIVSTKSIQRDYAVDYPHLDAIAPVLTDIQVEDAIRYNSRRFNLTDEWEISLVRDVLGISPQPAVVDRAFVEALAQFQVANGIAADGKNGPVTAARLSRELFHESSGLTGRARVELLRSSRRMGTRAMRIRVNNAAHLLDQRGSAEFGVMWEVPDASANGFVIQHVRISGNITDCHGNPVAMNGFVGARDYWEVWRVVNGHVRCGNLGVACSGSDDTFRTATQNAGTKGAVTESGHVSFFPDYLLDANWITGIVHPAGDLPHRATRPPFWNEGETMLHQMVITFDDCVSPATSAVTATP